MHAINLALAVVNGSCALTMAAVILWGRRRLKSSRSSPRYLMRDCAQVLAFTRARRAALEAPPKARRTHPLRVRHISHIDGRAVGEWVGGFVFLVVVLLALAFL